MSDPCAMLRIPTKKGLFVDEYSIYDYTDYYREPGGLDPNDDYKWGPDEDEDEGDAEPREDFGWFGEMGLWD